MDAGGQTFLSQCSHYTGRQQERHQKRPHDTERAQEKQTRARQDRGGKRNGRTNPRLCIPRMFGQNKGGSEGSVWNGHQGGASSQEEEAPEVSAAVGLLGAGVARTSLLSCDNLAQRRREILMTRNTHTHNTFLTYIVWLRKRKSWRIFVRRREYVSVNVWKQIAF